MPKKSTRSLVTDNGLPSSIACRLTTTYAGFEGESSLLQELQQRGLKQPQVAPNLYAGDGLLMARHHDPVAPWQTTQWLADMRRSLRPNQFARMIRNEFVPAEASFIDLAWLDRCTDPVIGHRVADKALVTWAGIDASVKHDSTALALVTWDYANQRVPLYDQRIFLPSPEQPIDFASAIEATILDWNARFTLAAVFYDPYQMTATAQALRAGVNMIEFPQTLPNLTAMAENLYGLIKGGNLNAMPNVPRHGYGRLATRHSRR
jgi:hypothetical protein